MIRKTALSAALLLLVSAGPVFDAKAAADHGRDIMDRVINKMTSGELYAQEIKPGQAGFKPAPDDCWAAGVQLTALTAAAKVDPDRYLPALKKYTAGLDSFRSTIDGIEGYDDGPHPKPPVRYYDDDAWIALGMIEAYEVTHDPKDLDRAKVALGLTLSGEDSKLGGGLYWVENKKESKNTCANAPGITAAVRMYQIDHDPKKLETAARLYRWTRMTLLDGADHLYFDHIDLDGKVQETKYTYNSALMIRAGCLLYDATGDKQYLTDARQTAGGAMARWCSPRTGAIGGPARFAHLLAESFLELSARDHDPKWADADHNAVDFLWGHVRDSNGFYSERWDETSTKPVEDILLIDQASAARAFFRAAWPQ